MTMKLPHLTTLIIALLLTPFGVAAQDKTTLLAPPPAPILQAQRIFLVNTGGNTELFDIFYSEMKSWSRYEIVDAPDKAELVFEFSSRSDKEGLYTNPVNLRTYSYSVDRVKISVLQSHTLLWSNTRIINGSKRKNRQKAIEQLLADFKVRMESPKEALTNTLDIETARIETDPALTSSTIRVHQGGPDRVVRDKQGRLIRVPRLISKPEPQYTVEARQAQLVGTVLLSVLFKETGEVTDIEVTSGLPNGLTEQAIAAVKRVKFLPAESNGKKIPYRMSVEYNFNLY